MNRQLFKLLTFLSISCFSQSPGGVSTKLELWLNASAGTTGTTEVSAWNDQSGLSHHAVSGGTGTSAGPELIANGLNFNPVISFSGSNIEQETMLIPGGLIDAGITWDDAFIYTIVKADENNETTFFRENLASGRVSAHLPFADNNVYFDYGALATGRSAINWESFEGENYLWTFGASTGKTTPSGTERSIYKNGELFHSNNRNASATGLDSANGGDFFLGSRSTTLQHYPGDVAEFIVYNSVPTAIEKQQIESYLAIKYGISLVSTAVLVEDSSMILVDGKQGDYRNSSGDIIWNSDDNSTFHRDIIAIGKDSGSNLEQPKSTSSNRNTVLTLEHVDALTDSEFVIVGNNGDYKSLTDQGKNSGYSSRIDRVWKSSVTGSPSNLSVTFDLSTLGILIDGSSSVADYALITSPNDIDFDAGGTVVNTTATFDVSNQTITFTGVTFANNEFFTLAVNDLFTPMGPSNITDEIRLWLRADQQVTGTTAVTKWNDISGYNNNTTTTFENEPTFNKVDINFNPSIEFDGVEQYLSVAGGLFENDTHEDFTVHLVTKSNAAENTILFNQEGDTGSFSTIIPNASSDFVYTQGTFTAEEAWGSSIGSYDVWTISHQSSTGSDISRIYKNGELLLDDTTSTVDDIMFTRDDFFLGSENGLTDHFNGSIAEVLVYTKLLEDDDRNKIISYLAIKYGITLIGENYVNSAGTVLWNTSTNAAYASGIIGIGQDTASRFLQKQSVSQSGNSILSISISDEIAASNNANGGSFNDDLDFFMVGNNSGGSTLDLIDAEPLSGDCSISIKKLNRDWKVANIGNVSMVTLSFDLSLIPVPDNFNLLIDEEGDGDFDNGILRTVSSSSLVGNQLIFENVILKEGEVFTLEGIEPTGSVIYKNGTWYRESGGNDVISTGDGALSVTIFDDVTLTDSAVCDCMNITTGNILTIPTGKYIEITDGLELGGDLYLEGTSELIQTGTTNENTNTNGNVYKILNEAHSSVFKYNYFTSPVHTDGEFSIGANLKINNGATLGDNITPGFISNDLEGFDTTFSTRWFHTLIDGGAFTEIDQNQKMTPGVGFTMKGTSLPNAYNLIGVPNNGVININVSANNSFLTGNPYPSTISTADFFAFGDNKTTTGDAIYLWDSGTGEQTDHALGLVDNVGGYATITSSVTVGKALLLDDSTDVGATETTGYIKPGQGFIFFSTAGGTVTFDNSMRNSVPFDDSRHFFKAQEVQTIGSTKGIVRLGFEYQTENNKTFHRQLAAVLNEGDTSQDKNTYMFDYYNDDAYWVANEESSRFIIRDISNVDEYLELPIGVVLDTEKEITFKIDDVEDFTNDIYLLDKQEDTVTKIGTTQTYTTVVEEGDNQERFSLIFAEDVFLDTEIIDNTTKTVLYVQDQHLHVVLETGTISKVEVYNLRGQLITSKYNTEPIDTTSVDLTSFLGELLVVKITTSNGSINKKIIID